MGFMCSSSLLKGAKDLSCARRHFCTSTRVPVLLLLMRFLIRKFTENVLKRKERMILTSGKTRKGANKPKKAPAPPDTDELFAPS